MLRKPYMFGKALEAGKRKCRKGPFSLCCPLHLHQGRFALLLLFSGVQYSGEWSRAQQPPRIKQHCASRFPQSELGKAESRTKHLNRGVFFGRIWTCRPVDRIRSFPFFRGEIELRKKNIFLRISIFALFKRCARFKYAPYIRSTLPV